MADNDYLGNTGGFPTGRAPMALDLQTPIRALTDRMVRVTKEQIAEDKEKFDKAQQSLIEALSFETVKGASDAVQQAHLENVNKLWGKWAGIIAENDGKLSMADRARLQADQQSVDAELAKMQTDVQQYDKVREMMLNPAYDSVLDKSKMKDSVRQYYEKGKIGSGGAWGLIIPKELSAEELLFKDYAPQLKALSASFDEIITMADKETGAVETVIQDLDDNLKQAWSGVPVHIKEALIKEQGSEKAAIERLGEIAGLGKIKHDFQPYVFRAGAEPNYANQGWVNIKSQSDIENAVEKNDILEGVVNLDRYTLENTAAEMVNDAYKGVVTELADVRYNRENKRYEIYYRVQKQKVGGEDYIQDVVVKIPKDAKDKRQMKQSILEDLDPNFATGKYSIDPMNIKGDWTPSDNRKWDSITKWEYGRAKKIMDEEHLGSPSRISYSKAKETAQDLQIYFGKNNVDYAGIGNITFFNTKYNLQNAESRKKLYDEVEKRLPFDAEWNMEEQPPAPTKEEQPPVNVPPKVELNKTKEPEITEEPTMRDGIPIDVQTTVKDSTYAEKDKKTIQEEAKKINKKIDESGYSSKDNLVYEINQDIKNDHIVKLYGSPINGDIIVNTALKYKIDPAELAATLRINSRYGAYLYAKKTKNVGGFNAGKGKTVIFSTWENAVEATARKLSGESDEKIFAEPFVWVVDNAKLQGDIPEVKDEAAYNSLNEGDVYSYNGTYYVKTAM